MKLTTIPRTWRNKHIGEIYKITTTKSVQKGYCRGSHDRSCSMCESSKGPCTCHYVDEQFSNYYLVQNSRDEVRKWETAEMVLARPSYISLAPFITGRDILKAELIAKITDKAAYLKLVQEKRDCHYINYDENQHELIMLASVRWALNQRETNAAVLESLIC